MIDRIIPLLGPKTQSLSDCWGGLSDLTAEDAAGALAGLEGGRYQVALALWRQDADAMRELLRSVLGRLRDRAWLRRDYRRARGIAWLAIGELIYNHRCSVCDGRGEVWLKDKAARPCHECAATGYRRPSDHACAMALDISVLAYRKAWKARQEVIWRLLLEWETDARRHVARRLSGGLDN